MQLMVSGFDAIELVLNVLDSMVIVAWSSSHSQWIKKPVVISFVLDITYHTMQNGPGSKLCMCLLYV